VKEYKDAFNMLEKSDNEHFFKDKRERYKNNPFLKKL